MERLQQMYITLHTGYANPINIGSNVVTTKWIGFIKLHLQQPHMDGITILKVKWPFIMEMEEGKSVIGKIKKGLKLITIAHNLRLHLEENTVQDTLAHSIFKENVKESYYEGKQRHLRSQRSPKISPSLH